MKEVVVRVFSVDEGINMFASTMSQKDLYCPSKQRSTQSVDILLSLELILLQQQDAAARN
jgi:hypothetical protein